LKKEREKKNKRKEKEKYIGERENIFACPQGLSCPQDLSSQYMSSGPLNHVLRTSQSCPQDLSVQKKRRKKTVTH